jgi:hypothetical protein
MGASRTRKTCAGQTALLYSLKTPKNCAAVKGRMELMGL